MQLCIARLRRDPADRDALFTRAAVLARFGMYPAALHCLRKIDRQGDAYPGLHRSRTRLLTEMDPD